MPVLEYHLVAGHYSDEQVGALLTTASRRYAEILNCPIERVRAFAHMHQPKHVAVAGRLVRDGAAPAPYFHFLVLQGRPQEQCDQLLACFTDLAADILRADRSLVRGGCWPIPPQYWSIAGAPASVTRSGEIDSRAGAAPLPAVSARPA
ncbi:MAG: 4-oxalocrotonate tautomerase [Pseudomonadota bacterium]